MLSKRYYEKHSKCIRNLASGHSHLNALTESIFLSLDLRVLMVNEFLKVFDGLILDLMVCEGTEDARGGSRRILRKFSIYEEHY